MLTHDVLETQTALELPAREMLAFANFLWLYSNQQAQNNSTQINAVGVGQANLSAQSNTQIVAVSQS
jgi:hypothetical protein